MSYVNDQAILSPESLLELNNGLQGVSADTGLGNRVSTGLPTIIPPTYQVPLTVADNYANNPFNTVGMIDPNLKHPRVQQYSIGMQHEFKGTVVEARYVGNHVVGAYRAFDFNQVVINSNGFLQDFLRAQKNGFLAQAAGGNFNPAYNSNIPGSQQLTVFPKLVKGALTDPNAINYLETGEVGELATYYQTNGYNPTNAVPFFQNPNALGTDYLTNYSSSSYNALQLELTPPHQVGTLLRGELHLVQGAERCRWRQPEPAAEFPGYRQSEDRALAREFRFDPHDQGGRLLRTAVRQGAQAELPPVGPRDRRLDFRQHDGVAIGRAVLDSFGARHAEPGIAIVLQHRRHQPDQEPVGQRGEVPDDGERSDDDHAIGDQCDGRHGREHGRRLRRSTARSSSIPARGRWACCSGVCSTVPGPSPRTCG